MDTIKIGEFLRDKRLAKGWTQEKFAEEAGVTSKTVSNWENGNFSYIKNESLDGIKRSLGLSPSQVFLARDLSEIDAETKESLDMQFRELNERVGDVQNVTITIEDRGVITMDVGLTAITLALIALAVAMWGAYPRTTALLVMCWVMGLAGVVFFFFGRKMIKSLERQLNERKALLKEKE